MPLTDVELISGRGRLPHLLGFPLAARPLGFPRALGGPAAGRPAGRVHLYGTGTYGTVTR
ncbi:hypothetical protein [Streptomyces lydicus]|uniref:hypothetical protein n=1 Tax=Streptomyces lydicus TaxID=47763 RepID=UPI00367C5104